MIGEASASWIHKRGLVQVNTFDACALRATGILCVAGEKAAWDADRCYYTRPWAAAAIRGIRQIARLDLLYTIFLAWARTAPPDCKPHTSAVDFARAYLAASRLASSEEDNP